MSIIYSPTFKCLEAVCMLSHARHLRRMLGSQASEKAQRQLNKLEFRAENLAGEAGYDAASRGMSAQVPSCIQSFRVLANAFIAEHAQVTDHQRFHRGASAAGKKS